jgi:hypothetical protein
MSGRSFRLAFPAKEADNAFEVGMSDLLRVLIWPRSQLALGTGLSHFLQIIYLHEQEVKRDIFSGKH